MACRGGRWHQPDAVAGGVGSSAPGALWLDGLCVQGWSGELGLEVGAAVRATGQATGAIRSQYQASRLKAQGCCTHSTQPHTGRASTSHKPRRCFAGSPRRWTDHPHFVVWCVDQAIPLVASKGATNSTWCLGPPAAADPRACCTRSANWRMRASIPQNTCSGR